MYESAISEHVVELGLAPQGASRTRRSPAPASAFATRSFDLFISIGLILFTLPLLIVIALAIKFSDGGPALFSHQRVGRGGKLFNCLKFRSMVVDADRRLQALLQLDAVASEEWARDHKLRADPRITSVGQFLRRSSLDELPQLFNVLRGDMSIVGPRPIVMSEVRRYGRRIADYCLVRPGITGLWQVSGRSDTTYRRRVAMDILYARHKSLAWDVQLLILTVPAVLLEKGSY
jgi:lipopolysaccharide/colanic/teichoic acid biosynthesis glycosyltransferase